MQASTSSNTLPDLLQSTLEYVQSRAIAEEYDDFNARNELFEHDTRFADRFVGAPGRLIDIGCGTGRHLVHFARRGLDVTGIDLSEYMLSIGRGVAEEDNIEQFSELADSMGFTLGCSRPIADSGWLPKSRQVGQSGKTVSSCNIYIAFGISGSVQHMAGMKHVPNIIAINTDAEASIFTIARYGVVADMFDIAEELKNHFD